MVGVTDPPVGAGSASATDRMVGGVGDNGAIGEPTRLLLFRGIATGGASGLSATGATIVDRPVAPFHGGLSTDTFLLPRFFIRSPKELFPLEGPLIVVWVPRMVPGGCMTPLWLPAERSAGGTNCPGFTLCGFPLSLVVISPE
jgi:hypothetical protein